MKCKFVMHIPENSSQQLYMGIILTQPPCNLTGPKAILEANLRLLYLELVLGMLNDSEILTETLISKVKSATQGNDWNDPWLRRDQLQHRDRPPSHPGQGGGGYIWVPIVSHPGRFTPTVRTRGAVVSHPIFFSDQLFYCSNRSIFIIISGKVTKIVYRYLYYVISDQKLKYLIYIYIYIYIYTCICSLHKVNLGAF